MRAKLAAIHAMVAAGCPPPPPPIPWYRRPGDIIAFIARVTCIAPVVKRVAPNCGCEERRKRLNDMAAPR